jgi:hypothetical protein
MGQKIANLILLGFIASFPISLYLMSTQNLRQLSSIFKPVDQDILEKRESEQLQAYIDTKIKLIANIESRILTTKAELLRHESAKMKLIADLENLRKRLDPVIERAKRPTHSSIAKGSLD